MPYCCACFTYYSEHPHEDCECGENRDIDALREAYFAEDDEPVEDAREREEVRRTA